MVVLGVMSLANAEVHLKHFGFSITEAVFWHNYDAETHYPDDSFDVW